MSENTYKALTYNKDKDWVLTFRNRKGCIETYDYQVSKTDPKNHFWSNVVKKCNDKVTNTSKYEFFHKPRPDGTGVYLQRVRTEIWGYAAGESLDNDALIGEQYEGIRPAPGYPACPDHTEKATLWSLLDAERNAGMTLTEHFAMLPTAAVSGWYIAHPKARYFGVGDIGRDQVEDYARRKGWTQAQAERWLAPNVGYDA